jgi:hypothetical protein
MLVSFPKYFWYSLANGNFPNNEYSGFYAEAVLKSGS